MDTKMSDNETDFKMVMNKIYKKTGLDCKQYKDNYLKRQDKRQDTGSQCGILPRLYENTGQQSG